MPGVPNASMARQVERAGFDAVYISGAGLANCTAGLPDVGLLTLNEVATLAGFIAKAVEDSGDRGCRHRFRRRGECRAHHLRTGTRRTRRLPSRRPGISETLRSSRGQTPRATDEMTAKIRAAVAAKRDRDFLVIARTDSRALENFDGAVKRANAYVAAGADAIFPEALQTKEEFRDFATEVKAPLLANMTEFGKSPSLSVAELGELGYRMVIFPQSAFRVSMKTTERIFPRLAKSGQARRMARPDADAEGTLRDARLRSGGGKLARLSSAVHLLDAIVSQIELSVGHVRGSRCKC